MIASRLPNATASARAAVGPTWRIDNATRIRHNGRSLACCRLIKNRAPLADSVPSLVVKKSDVSRSALVRLNRSPSSVMTLAASSAVAAS